MTNVEARGMAPERDRPGNEQAADGDGDLVIRVTPCVLEAAAAYLTASGLVRWNEPDSVAHQHALEFLADLIEASDPIRKGMQPNAGQAFKIPCGNNQLAIGN